MSKQTWNLSSFNFLITLHSFRHQEAMSFETFCDTLYTFIYNINLYLLFHKTVYNVQDVYVLRPTSTIWKITGKTMKLRFLEDDTRSKSHAKTIVQSYQPLRGRLTTFILLSGLKRIGESHRRNILAKFERFNKKKEVKRNEKAEKMNVVARFIYHTIRVSLQSPPCIRGVFFFFSFL